MRNVIVLNPTFFKFFNYEAEFEEGIYESNLVANDFFFLSNCIGGPIPAFEQ